MSILHYASSPKQLNTRVSLGASIARRALSIGLMLSLLSTSTLAAPTTIVNWANDARISFMFWYASSGVASWLQGRSNAPGKLETQRDRDLRISRVQIFPGDVDIQVGEHVNFAAVAYDAEDKQVG